ncbi:MAG: TIGR02444 family protein [Pseudomonadota bacterium]
MPQPLWDYAVATYARAGVAAACLALQDEQGADVNLVLYALWLADQGQALELEQVAAVDAVIDEWRREVVMPLRELRRRWRALPSAAEFRTSLHELELQAERHQLETMVQNLDPGACQAGIDPGTNLAVLGQYWGLEEAVWSDLKAALGVADRG